MLMKYVVGVVALWLVGIAVAFAFWGGLIYLAVKLIKG